MDLTKAQRLLNKIQAFLDNGNGHELSRLEKDLIKSYVQQLYEAVTSDEVSTEPVTKTQKQEPVMKSETSHQRHTELPKEETYKPITEHKPAFKSEPAIKEEPFIPSVKVEPPSYEPYKPPVVKADPVEHAEYKPPVYKDKAIDNDVVPEAKPHHHYTEEQSLSQNAEEQRNEMPMHKPHADDSTEKLNKLFELQKPDEISSRFGHVPIASIESAMGLNERIFTLNELFGGDKGLFDAWCSKLNSLNSFAEAKNVLITGPARDFKWAEPERIKMAEQFIRIVARRYPKSIA